VAILIVEDSRDEQALLLTRLRAAGYETPMVADSAEAAFGILDQVNARQTTEEVDLILMDIMLPGVDGLEACRRITTTESLQDIPIIVITAKTEQKDLLAAFAAGAMDYIRKPVNPVELVARVSSPV
jgi:DNA-binding response OmpR family regulator